GGVRKDLQTRGNRAQTLERQAWSVTSGLPLPQPPPSPPGKGSRALPRPGGRRKGDGWGLRTCRGRPRAFGSEQPWETGAFFTKVVDLGASSLKLEIWDTAGQEKYHSVCHLYFRGANAALLVYDITRKDSFHKARQWLADLEKELHPGEGVVMLVGNKTDLGEQREVTFQEGKEFAESNKLLFMETSAKLNLQVSEVFSTVAQELLQREARQSHSAQGDAAVVLNASPAPQAKCCAR
uniref:Ras-related protein Rab-17 n=1 Tax=Urocitellus parryii TaxID=9999 RepID=A0A8D2KND8_UROPR